MLAAMILALASVGQGRPPDAPPARDSQPPAPRVPADAATLPSPRASISAVEIAVALGALALAAVVISLATVLRLKAAIDADMMFKLIGLSLTVGSAIFLIGAGYGQDQIAPVMGFLGTALGFIFGRNSAPVAPEPAPSKS